MKELTQHYRGTQPAIIVNVLEGYGTEEHPSQIVKYVLQVEEVGGISRPVTIGKIIPLSEEEQSWYK